MSDTSRNYARRTFSGLEFLTRSSSANNPVKILNATNSMLKLFMFVDICFMITAITFILMVVSNQVDSKEIVFGGVLGVYATVSSFVNSLANYGIRTWRRGFIVPWLAFYLLLFLFLMMRIAESIYAESLQWRQVVLFAGSFIIYSCWRHMLKQHNLMTGPRPQQVVVDVESMVRDLVRRGTATREPPLNDSPPKYEDLEDIEVPPPQYSSCVQQVVDDNEGQVNQSASSSSDLPKDS